MKEFIYILLFTLLITSVLAQVEVEYSEDNVTWFVFDEIDQTNRTACQGFLDQNTEYYVRAKDPTTNWAVSLIRTLFGGLNEKMIEVAIILIAVIAIFMFLGLMFQGFGAKIFFFGISFLELLILLFVSFNEIFDASVEGILRTNFHLMLVVIGGMFVFAIIRLLMVKLNPVSEEKEEDFKWKDG